MLAFLIRAYEWILRRLCGPVRGPDGVPVEYWPDFRRRDARVLVERMGRILPWAWTWDDTSTVTASRARRCRSQEIHLLRCPGGGRERHFVLVTCMGGCLHARQVTRSRLGALVEFALAVLERWDITEGLDRRGTSPRQLLRHVHGRAMP